MRTVNVTFEFAKDCPYNLDGSCLHSDGPNDCRYGRSRLPVESCPLPDAAKSEVKEQKFTAHNKQSTKPCPWCNGKGYRFKGVNYQDDCVVCSGSGRVKASYIC